MRSRTLLSLAFLLLVAACAKWGAVEPRQQVIEGRLQLTPPITFSRIVFPVSRDRLQMWTVDGPSLNQMLVLPELGHRMALLAEPSGADRANPTYPLFRSTMAEPEIMELIADTLSIAFQKVPVSTSNLQPTTFAERPGFRFDFTFSSREDLDYRGTFIGGVDNGTLAGVMLVATAVHHYDTLRPELERLAASARRIRAAS